MNRLHLVMPMAGKGSRFSDSGYSVPKPLIEIKGKPFFYWAVQSVEKFIRCEDITFVVLSEHIKQYHIDQIIRQYWQDAIIIELKDVTRGAAETGLLGIEHLQEEDAILLNDCDHLFCSDAFNAFQMEYNRLNVVDAAVLTFPSRNPAYGYLQYDENGHVIRTVEKQPVSNEAICGAYYFNSKRDYVNACRNYFQSCSYKEYFLSGVLNTMIDDGKTVKGFPTEFHLSFGTPEEYAAANQTGNDYMFSKLDGENKK